MQKEKLWLVILLVACLAILPVFTTQVYAKTPQIGDENVNLTENRIMTITAQTPSGIPFNELEKYCDEKIMPALENTLPGASIAVVYQGETVFEKGYGYADIEKKILSDPKSTVYEYGSVSKLFTWTSVMKLYEQGKIDLNEDIREYLPEDFSLPLSYNKKITLLNLMNHQGGFGDYVIHLFSKENEIVGLRESLEENKVDQYYEPGFASSYSNYGAGLAGYIVECVTEMPMYQYAYEEIMKPSGMNVVTMNPDLETNQQLKAKKAKLYEYEDSIFVEQNASYVSMYPAGAGNGTVESLAKFAKALLDEKNHPIFEKNKTQQEMLSTSYQAVKGVPGIAHGFIEYDGEYPVYWHNGGTDHSSTFFAVVPEQDFGVVICTNTGDSGLSVIQKLGFDLVKKRNLNRQEQMAVEKLPDVKIVEGDYLDFREDRGGLLRVEAFIRHFSPIKVRAVNETQIMINGLSYTQISPYIFQNDISGSKCAFLVENGKVIKYSNMLDYLPLTFERKVKVYIQAMIFVLLMLSVIVEIIASVFALFRKKINLDHGIMIMMILLWGGIVVNVLNIICMIMEWVFFVELRGWIRINWFLGGLLGICSVIGIMRKVKYYQKNGERRITLSYVQQFSFYIISFAALLTCWSLGIFCIWK